MFTSIQLLLLAIACNAGVLVNVTVDDAGSDPRSGESIVYAGPGHWNIGGKCSKCNALLDKNLVYNQTWHDGTYLPNTFPFWDPIGPLSAMFTFNGSAIYVFCAIAPGPEHFTNMTFYLDGDRVGEYQRTDTDTSKPYEYNVLAYSNTSLPAGLHQFKLLNGQNDNSGNSSLALFDYLIYSYETEVAPASLSSSLSQSASETDRSSSRSSSTIVSSIGTVMPNSSSLATETDTQSTTSTSSSGTESQNSSGRTRLIVFKILIPLLVLTTLGAIAWIFLLRSTFGKRLLFTISGGRSRTKKFVPYTFDNGSPRSAIQRRSDEYLGTPDYTVEPGVGAHKSGLSISTSHSLPPYS